MQERLQKIIATAGITSRRKAEELITQGRVTVNGQMIVQLGSKADVERDHIRVNGKLIRVQGRRVYVLLNKPPGFVSTLKDPEGRPTVISLLRGIRERIYPVGRLDYTSSGIMLLTNDGELANGMMTHASKIPRPTTLNWKAIRTQRISRNSPAAFRSMAAAPRRRAFAASPRKREAPGPGMRSP